LPEIQGDENESAADFVTAFYSELHTPESEYRGLVNMSENRVYPRIQSDWKLYLESPEGKREVGYVKDISLTGASLQFVKEYGLEPGKHRFTLKLTNSQLEPSELIITGLKEWERREQNEVFLGIAIDRLDREKRSSFVRFLSRSDKLKAEAILLED